MHTELSEKFKNTPQADVASKVIAKCVHCGFCNATCPTYQLLGDELDGPRGRIYQMKQIFEGAQPTAELALHLDRCLTCRNCETTCPSGVEYHKLLDVSRDVVEQNVPRGKLEMLHRWALTTFLSRRQIITPALRCAQFFRVLMPAAIKKNIPERQNPGEWPTANHSRRMLIVEGCVQPGMKPLTNSATARVLDRLGITAVKQLSDGCCGALGFHLNAQDKAKVQMRQNIDAWWPHVEAGIEAIISTASGCGVMIKDYADVFSDDKDYAQKASHISALTKDLSQVIDAEDLQGFATKHTNKNKTAIAFHPPCTLQHGQKLNGVVESILTRCGFELTPISDSHLCCGSAGTYSIFQKNLSNQLLMNKIKAISNGQPEFIATANIGCQLHLESAAQVPVIHWIELLDRY